jgi:hypothetical protein
MYVPTSYVFAGPSMFMMPCFIWCGAHTSSGDHPKKDLALMVSKLLQNSPKL